jgi:AAA family ATP:ADP antiporter
VDLRAGERGPALRAAASLFGLIAGHTILETARDAVFLVKLPVSRLGLVYALLAGLSLVAVRINAAFVQRFGRRNGLVITLMAAAYGTTMIYLAPRTPVMAYVLYLWSALLGTVMVVQFWMLAGHNFTVAQGKRLFGPLAAGGVLGAVAGASGAAALLMRFHVGALLPAASAVFLATGLLLTAEPSDQTAPRAGEAPRVVAWGGLGGDPYLRRLGGLIAVITAAVLVADYLFKSTVVAALPRDELGPFIARYYALLNAVALLVQLGLTGLVVRRLGVIGSLLVLPAFLLAGAAGVVASGGALVAVLLTRGADGALRHSLNRVAFELTWMPVADGVKSVAKAFADTALGRGVQALVAGVLFALAMFSLDRPLVLAGLILLLSLSAVALIVSMRRPYLDLFRRALQRPSLPGDVGGIELDLDSAEVLIEALSSRDPARAIAAMDLLASQRRARLVPSLILYHDAPAVLIRALEVIATPDRRDWVELAQRLLDHQDEGVRVAAVRALVGIDQHEAAMARLFDISPAVRAHTAFWLAARDDVAEPHRDPRIRDILAIEGSKRSQARGALLDATARRGDQRWAELLLEIAEDNDHALNAQLAEAVTQVRDPRFIDLLLSRLGGREGRGQLRRALASYGAPALEALGRAIADPHTSPRLRLHLPRTISQFGSQAAADLLVDILSNDRSGAVRFKALRGVGRMIEGGALFVDRGRVMAQARRDLTEVFRLRGLRVGLGDPRRAPPEAQGSAGLLLELLEDKERLAVERVFRLLQIVHRRDDLRSAHLALSSSERRMRATSAEFLDALTIRYVLLGEDHGVVRDLIRILADDLPEAEQVARAAEAHRAASPPARPEEALAELLRARDPAVASIAARLASDLGIERIVRDIQRASQERPAVNPEAAHG